MMPNLSPARSAQNRAITADRSVLSYLLAESQGLSVQPSGQIHHMVGIFSEPGPTDIRGVQFAVA